MSFEIESRQPGTSIDQDGRYEQARTVTLVGAVVDAILGVAKVVGGLGLQSHALIADGVHSLSDLVTDGIVLIATREASRKADADHPYGHGRIETLATVLLGVSLIAVALGMVGDAVWRILTPDQLMNPQAWALLIAALSVVAKEAMYQYTVRAARRLRSKLLEANAWHSRSDALSSVIVMVGVAGSLLGFEYLDAVAAIGVSLMIGKIGAGLAWQSVRELIDTGLDEDQVREISDVIRRVPGVTALHMLRTRSMGPDTFIDVHILVEPTLSVSEGHQIGETVRAKLAVEIDDVADVTVHIDPEDDETSSPSTGLPAREDLSGILLQRWAGIAEGKQIERLILHYLDGQVHVDVILPVSERVDIDYGPALASRFAQQVADIAYLGKIEVYFH
ncbi:MAG TPA: cation transporter [Chromatiaceae bacterium]|nr:cation transporter [Chromatiaceae bacterium]HIA07813.1 cation transporter [Chromatiaceae bacterium]HIN81570.1 cation transporter [Chromatiales bacterium]